MEFLERSTNKAEIESRSNDFGLTPLMVACYLGQNQVVLNLLEMETLEVNATSKVGSTALIYACYKGHSKIALALLNDRRVDRQLRNFGRLNALDYARIMGLRDVVGLLLETSITNEQRGKMSKSTDNSPHDIISSPYIRNHVVFQEQAPPSLNLPTPRTVPSSMKQRNREIER